MCIICNCDGDVGFDFLVAFYESQSSMKKAAAAMKAASRAAKLPEDRKRYDQVHKRMVKLLREWNSIEHMREDDGSRKGKAGWQFYPGVATLVAEGGDLGPASVIKINLPRDS